MATKRLIDANALMEDARRCSPFVACLGDIVDIELLVNDQPTVDAVEVVHGEWTIIEDDYCGLIGLECSECEITWWFEDESSFGKYHYCPGCGAKMDGERKDND